MHIRPILLALFVCFWGTGSAFAQSARSGVGAIPYADAGGTGVTFRTWAPNATAVSVRGSFNGWGGTALAKDLPGGTWNGHWSLDSSRARAGDEYKFQINNTSGWRKDPRGKRVVNSSGNSIVYNPQAFNWGAATNFNPIWRNDLVIYEMHVGTFNGEDWLPSTFDECTEKIPHLKALGISAVQLMPVMEFPGDFSWGYNPSDPYAVESAFGGPDGLKRFVKACHENGIAVLMDVVHNHYGPTDLQLWQYDGWSQNGLGGIFFYNEGWKAATPWGDTRPDYGRQEVKDYIHGQIRMYVEEFKLDGFRWDSVYNIRHYSDTWNPDGSAMLAQVNDWLAANHPGVYRIAEDHAFDSPVNFEAQWDHGYLNDIRWLAAGGSDSDRDMNTLAYHLGNGGLSRVVYVESHDTCGDLNNKHRLPYDIDNGNPDSYWARKRALLANAIVLVSPGIPMIFAGSEMHEWFTFSNNQALRWALTNQNAGIVKAYGDLIRLRRNVYGNTAGLKQPGSVNVHHINNAQKVVGAIRWDQGGQVDDLVIALNCSATARTNYAMPFPSAGTWHCLYNSDLQAYDPSFGDVGPAVGGTVIAEAGGTATLALGAYSLQIYSKTPIPQESAAAFAPPNPAGCQTTVTITYTPGDGPLANAAAVSAYIGRNTWQNPSNFPMVASNGVWILEYVIPELTYEFNLSFTDGAEAWDNNEGLNWTIPVSNCGDLPAQAVWSPQAPQGCVPVEITYQPNGGPLMGASNIYLHIGRNNWKDVSQLPLAQFGENEWRTTYAIPADTWQVDFVLYTQTGPTEADRIWDNNNFSDWHVLVQNCLRVNEPFLAITNPAPAISVSNAIASVPVQGTADLLSGHLRWSNSLNHASGAIPVATNWTIASVPLAAGVNLIRVSGTNSTINPNQGAWDSPTNSSYNGTAWPGGSTGGQLFQPWIITAEGNGSSLMASNEPSLSLGPRAWTLQASEGGFIQAIRPIAAPLVPGDKVSFVFENGGIDGGAGNSSIGVAFQNRFDQRLTEILFNGGDTNYVINGLEWSNTGIPWGTNARSCTLEMLTELTYRFTINGQAFEGELAEKSELLISRIRFWNWNAGTGNDRRFYIGDLSITGAPLPVLDFSAEVAVTRAASTNAPPRETQSWTPAGDGSFVATVDNPAGIASNIWFADELLGGAWNWALLPASAYTISNNTVTFSPSPGTLFQLYSVGKPGNP